MDDEINLIDYLKVVNKRKVIIVVFMIIAGIYAFFQTALVPKMYQAEVTMLSLSSGLSGMGSGLSSYMGSSGSSIKIEPILKSKVLARMVAQKVNFKNYIINKNIDEQEIGKEPTFDDIVSALMGGIKSGDESKIIAEWDNPEIAALVANAYARELIVFFNQKAININLQILDEAEPDYSPCNKKSGQNVTIGAIVGLFFGIIIAFILEYWEKVRVGFSKNN